MSRTVQKMEKSYKDAMALLSKRRQPPRDLKITEGWNSNLEGTKFRGRSNLSGMADNLRRLGYPDNTLDHLDVIHVAGTKGKGSTCAFTDCFLRAHGERTGFPRTVGLYTGPHVKCIRERLRINFEPISEEHFARYFFEVWDVLSNQDDKEINMPGYLQLLTLVSFHAFMREGVDVAVFETNSGGEHDATNVLKPIVTGVTQLAMDHVRVLGPTIADIAWHKAGIFKDGIPALSVPQESTAIDMLRNRANEKNVDLTIVNLNDIVPANVRPEVQKMNASLAIELANTFLNKRAAKHHYKITEPDVLRGIELFSWPGRFQHIVEGSCQWFLDMAHNELSLQVAGQWFAETVSASQSNASPLPHILIFSQASERDARALLKSLGRSLQTCGVKIQYVIFCTLVERQDGVPSNDLFYRSREDVSLDLLQTHSTIWKEIDPTAEVSIELSIKGALDLAKEIGQRFGGMQTLVTGTSRLVGHALHLLQ